MGSLFQGTPQTATSYTTSTTETPKWMQDAIYNQIQIAQNIANRPFEAYEMPTVAELSPLQQQAYRQVQENAGFYKPTMTAAQTGMQGFSTAGTADQLRAAQAANLRPGMIDPNLQASQQLFGRAAGVDVAGAGAPAFGAAGSLDMLGAADPLLSRAAQMSGVRAASPAINRSMAMDMVSAAQPYLTRAAGMDIVGAAQPFMQQAGATTAEALSERALAAASPYLQSAAQSTAERVGEYMSPYQQGVLDLIAKQGARNLRENILPSVSDAFIRAGQFGSSRMGEAGSRAMRDTQEAILNAQAQAAQQGYGQALQAAQADLARQAGLAGTVGSISGADLSRILSGGAQYGQLGQTAGQLTGQQMQQLANIGQTTGQLTGQQAQNLLAAGQALGQLTTQEQAALANIGQTRGQLTGQQMANLTNLGQAQTSAAAQQANILANLAQAQTQAGQVQQQFGLGAAQVAQGAQAQDYARQMSALQSMAQLAQQEQGMRAADVASLESAGRAQQAQAQRELDAAARQFEMQRLYPQQQADWLSTQIRGMAPITPQMTIQSGTTTGDTYTPSPLAQLASALSVYKGAQNI